MARTTEFPTTAGILTDDTETMYRSRRDMEQRALKQLAQVKARDHEARIQAQSDEPQEGLQQHPHLDSQRFDGVDIVESVNMINDPQLKEKVLRELQNKLEHKQKLQNLNQNTSKDTPKPGFY